MPIVFDCSCGKTLRVGDETAGRRVKCPVCGAVRSVPKPNEAANEEPQFEVVEDEPETPPARSAKKSTPPDDDDDEPRPKKKPVRNDDDDDDEPRPKKKSAHSYDDEDDEDERPRRRKIKKRRRRSSAYAASSAYDDNYRGRGESDLTPVDWFLCIFCPGIGCIVGLIRLLSGSGAGAKMMGISLMCAVIWNVLRFALAVATGQ